MIIPTKFALPDVYLLVITTMSTTI